MKEIQEWLAKGGQDYAQGVALYAAHGKSRVLQRSLAYGATDFTRATLRRELEKLAAECHAKCHANASPVAPVGEKKAPAPVAAALQPPVNPHEPTQNDPDVRRQRSTWFAERDRLHAQLELVATDAARHVMAERVLVLAELLAASYDEEAGRAPAPPEAASRADLGALADAGEIRRLLANLRPQASKLKKKPDRGAALAQVLADIKLLETKLKKDHE